MKAKHIRKLRKKIGKMQTYQIRESFRMFGDFFGLNRMRHICKDNPVIASSSTKAIERYMQRYRRNNNKMNDYERSHYWETTEQWGRIMVTDEKGFMRFYK